MDQVRNLADIGFKQAARIRIGQHDARHIVGLFQLCAQFVHVHAPTFIGLDLVHNESALHRCRGICSVSGSWHQNAFAGLALAPRDERLTDRHHAAELTMCPCLRAHRHRGHPRQRFQPGGQLINQLQRALHRGLRL